mmetsp:Transcript_30156/g.46656  ORF Transcript_30156/g.46656 Transcript_30156/m.46656 type:complete len:200 (+) Transcript_30156:229-828(+)
MKVAELFFCIVLIEFKCFVSNLKKIGADLLCWATISTGFVSVHRMSNSQGLSQHDKSASSVILKHPKLSIRSPEGLSASCMSHELESIGTACSEEKKFDHTSEKFNGPFIDLSGMLDSIDSQLLSSIRMLLDFFLLLSSSKLGKQLNLSFSCSSLIIIAARFSIGRDLFIVRIIFYYFFDEFLEIIFQVAVDLYVFIYV